MEFNGKLLSENADRLGITVAERQAEKLDLFASLLKEKNKVMNLTAITDEDGIAVKHFADSLSVLKANIPQGAKVMDMGCGAGFPGIPLLIMRPDLHFTFLDSTAKKLGFVSDALSSLGLEAEVVHGRAEDLGRNPDYREKYDFVVSRAVASLNILCEYCLPFVKQGGVFAAMKGSMANEEIKKAEYSLKVLGGKIKEQIDFSLTDGERSIIIIEKSSRGNPGYPRPSAQISKKPL